MFCAKRHNREGERSHFQSLTKMLARLRLVLQLPTLRWHIFDESIVLRSMKSSALHASWDSLTVFFWPVGFLWVVTDFTGFNLGLNGFLAPVWVSVRLACTLAAAVESLLASVYFLARKSCLRQKIIPCKRCHKRAALWSCQAWQPFCPHWKWSQPLHITTAPQFFLFVHVHVHSNSPPLHRRCIALTVSASTVSASISQTQPSTATTGITHRCSIRSCLKRSEKKGQAAFYGS